MKEAIITYREKPDAEGGHMVDHWQELVRCKDCKHFAIKEHWADVGYGAKILCADNCPTCEKWGRGCKTDPDGYCFLAERK